MPCNPLKINVSNISQTTQHQLKYAGINSKCWYICWYSPKTHYFDTSIMSRYTTNKLSDPEVRHAKPKDKKYKLPDGGGLYCEVLITGTKVWRYNYRIQGKQKTFTIGEYPTIGLSEARNKRDTAKAKISEGIDPSQQKQIQKRAVIENAFQAIAKTWLEKKQQEWTASYFKKVESYLRRDVYPWLGKRDISKIEAPEIIPVIEKVAERGAIDASKTVKQFIQQIFDFALVHGKVSRNPAKDINLQLILPKTTVKHYAAITDPVKLGELLRAIDHYQGTITVRLALKLWHWCFNIDSQSSFQ